jgi:hypothetical protein
LNTVRAKLVAASNSSVAVEGAGRFLAGGV